MVTDVTDTVQLLAQQYGLRQPWHNDSLDHLSSMVYVILNQKADGSISCLLIAAGGPLAEAQLTDVLEPINPGVYRLTASVVAIKNLLFVLRNMGYVLVVYKYQSFAPWIKELDALPHGTDADPYDLVAINKALPSCHVYVELFGGSAPLLYARGPSPVEVCNDRGSYVVDFAKTLRHASRFNCFFIMSRVFPFSLPAEPSALRRYVQTVPRDDHNVTRSFAWYNMVRSAYAAAYDGLPPEAKEETLPAQDGASSALRLLDPYLPMLHGRLLRVQYENNDYIKVVNTFDSNQTLFWVDVPVTLGNSDDTAELTDAVKALNEVNGAVALYLPDTSANHALSQRIAEGYLSKWKANRFSHSTVYTRNVRIERS